MSEQEIHVPDIGDFEDVDIIEVLVVPGDAVGVDDPLITLESDKASMDVPSPLAGRVQEVKVKVGDRVSEGDLIVLLESEASEKSAPETAPPTPDAPPAPVPTPAETPALAAAPAAAAPAGGIVSFDRVYASPSVRRLARERKIDLNRVRGSGRKGRVTKADLDANEQGAAAPAAVAGVAGIPTIPAQDFSKFGDVEILPLTKIKRLTGINLSRAWLNVPHVTHQDEADITDLEAYRQALKPRAEKAEVRVTLLSFFMKACAAALKEFPTFNASLDASGEQLVLKKYCHIGVAVDTPGGLVVPVFRDVDRKGIFQLSAELMQTSAAARAKKLKPGDMQGAGFTISSLGGIGGTAFTPIVNAPEVAILGLTRSQEKPFRGANDEIRWRLMQPLSLSYDHRVVDGAEAARFVRYLAELVQDIRLLLN